MGGQGVRITFDPNVLLGVSLRDATEQASGTAAVLLRTTIIAVPVPGYYEYGRVDWCHLVNGNCGPW